MGPIGIPNVDSSLLLRAWCAVLGERRKHGCSPKTKWQTPGTKTESKHLEKLIMHPLPRKKWERRAPRSRPTAPLEENTGDRSLTKYVFVTSWYRIECRESVVGISVTYTGGEESLAGRDRP